MASYPPGDFAWGPVDISGRKAIVRRDQNSGYRCPICKLNQNTTRKETFRKHLLTHGKIGNLKIPSMKEKCEYCPRYLEPNKNKRKLHLQKNCKGYKVHAAATTDKERLASDEDEDSNEEAEYDDTLEEAVDETVFQPEPSIPTSLSPNMSLSQPSTCHP